MQAKPMRWLLKKQLLKKRPKVAVPPLKKAAALPLKKAAVPQKAAALPLNKLQSVKKQAGGNWIAAGRFFA